MVRFPSMDPVALLVVALGALGYYLFTKDDQARPEGSGQPGAAASSQPSSDYLPPATAPAGGASPPVLQRSAASRSGPVARRAAPLDKLGVAESNLQQMRSRIGAASSELATELADRSYENPDRPKIGADGRYFTKAFRMFMDAGAFGVASVAPAVDGAGFANVTQPFTQHAWGLNSQMVKVSGGTKSWESRINDAKAVEMLATQMAGLYGSAIAAARRAQSSKHMVAGRPDVPENAWYEAAAEALAVETDATALRVLATRVASAGLLSEANELLSKADHIGAG